ncbi:uncharacterized protein UMAG_12032 [Mycosarcoma maydis]|uniref:DNA 3'-5' helicase n=1 Tax=Mycosarcoma maydis TaxID=5270 RepID=A0A0D1DQH5_MYCMD|nr:uncharacterized protein UMAG_12032 [Ustilago maydis 521]KIS66241.1 hypothetical protein UMAG_12032 [Ustilago maydis 521]|eukprot:XP_011392352.1 hypothetical protein UMAG_12032 [Ustilago maydis 521]
MATGSGKSALFTAPLFWLRPASVVVVVVVPFVALIEDLIHQSRGIGIVASKWAGYRCSDKVEGSALVFVAAENCYSEPFGLWIQSLQQQERLAALFFDECHVAITQVHFRPVMDKIKRLMSSVAMPLYFLTATLPPSMVTSFKESLMLPQDDAGLIRAATNRKNVSYLVKQVASTAQLPFCLQSLLRAHPCGPVMVFCKSKSNAEMLAGDLGCPFVASEIEAERKMATLQAWLTCAATETGDTLRFMVGTSAIGTGTHPPHVQLVAQYGDAWDLVSYVQESGRAGRSGGPASAVLLATQRAHEVTLQEYIQEKMCWRSVLSTYLDGMPVTCLSQPELALCDLCKCHVAGPSTPPAKGIGLDSPPPSEKRDPCSRQVLDGFAATAWTLQEPSPGPLTFDNPAFDHALLPDTPPKVDATRIKALLDGFTTMCTLCYLFCCQHTCHGSKGIHHRSQDCDCWKMLPRNDGERINGSYIGRIKARIQKAKNIACFSCLVPIRICHRGSSTDGQTWCTRRYADIVLPVVAAVLRSEDHYAEVMQRLGCTFTSVSHVEQTLGTSVPY